MKISCPACSAKYSIADDKVQERLAKIRCRKCGATIVIDGKTSPPHVYTASGEGAEPASTAEPGGPEYSVDFGEGDQRTMSVKEIVRAYHSGQITGETYVWTDGFTDWKPLSDVPELVSAVGSGPSSAAPSPWDVRSGAPSGGTRAASRASVRPSADLFGGINRAGSEDEVATSAPEQPSSAGSTGSRNESSVLFSLSALTSAAQAQRPATRPAQSAVSEDSGLIDLKALTAAAVKSDANASATAAVPAVAPLAPPLGVTAPLGLTPPLGGVATSADVVAAQNKSRAPLIVGSLIGIGMIAIAAALMLRPAAPPPPEPVVVAAPPVPTPAPTPAPSPEPVVAAAPPATGAPEEPKPETKEEDASAKKTAARPRPAARKTTSSSSTASDDKPAAAKTEAATPKKSSSSGNCGCPPADLQCAMRCAAKKK